ncbi:hypothetical protein ABPG77_006375 [Micractinium sp. CCAP 211/92]
MARKHSLWLTLAALIAITGGIAAQDAPAPGPAPASPGGGVTGGGGTPTQQQMSAMAAAFNQDIVLNSDLYSSVPEILSGGLGFTNIIGVANLDRDTVRAANGTWRVNVTCANGQPPPTRVLTSAATAVWTGGYNCIAENYDGLPVCFSWPVLPSTISNKAITVTLSNGTKMQPPCIGISPNLEFNERHCVVLFGKMGNRLPAGDPDALFVSGVEVTEGSGFKLVGPKGPVSAEGLKFTNPSGKGPYQGAGPYIMRAKLSELSDVGEGISLPPFASQVAFPNDGVALYGPYNGSVGADGVRLRLRLFYSGGMTPDGVKAFQPGDFAKHFYILANSSEGEMRLEIPGQEYALDDGLVMVVGMADTGRKQEAYDDCYQEDYDNYLDIIIDASDRQTAALLGSATVEAFRTDERYAPLYNPGGPGNDPVPDVVYSSPAAPQSVPISLALDDPATITYCSLGGKTTRDAEACTQMVNAALAAAPPMGAPGGTAPSMAMPGMPAPAPA